MRSDKPTSSPRWPLRRRWLAIGLIALTVAIIGAWAARGHGGSQFRHRHTVTLWTNPRPDGGSSFGYCPIAFSHDGRFVAAADCDDRIIVVNAATGKRVASLSVGVDSEAAESFVFSGDGRTLIAAGSAGKVYVWDAPTREVIRSFPLTDKPVVVEHDSSGGMSISYPCYGVIISEDGNKVVSGHADEELIRIWDVHTGKPEVTLADAGPVFPESFSARGNLLALDKSGEELSVWDVSRAPARKLMAVAADRFATDTVAFSHDERILAIATDRNEVEFWDCRKGTLLRTHSLLDPNVPDADVDIVRFCVDDRVLITGSSWRTDPWWTAITGPSWLFRRSRGCVQFWDVATGESLDRVFMKSDVESVAASPDGRQLAVGSWEGVMSLLHAPSSPLPQSNRE